MCFSNVSHLSTDLRLVHAVSSLTLAFFGTCGNALSIALICQALLYRTAPTMMLIADLCVANLISTTFILPCIAANSFHEHWLYGEDYCQVFAYAMYVTITTECLFLIEITIIQYLVIVHRVSNNTILYRRRELNLFILLVLPWLLVMLIYLIPLTKTWDEFAYDPQRGYCTLRNLQQGTGFQSTVAIIMTSLMTLTIFYCYPAIFYVQYKSRRKTVTSVLEAADRFRGRNRNTQLLRMIMAILCNYAVTYLPFLAISAIDPCLENVPLVAYTVVIYISWTHTATNPVIYALTNTKINALWRGIFTCGRNEVNDKTAPPATDADEIKVRCVEISATTNNQS